MDKEIKQCKVVLGRFQPFTLGHLKIATYTSLQGPDKEQADALREQPNLEEISKLPTIILAILVPNDKVDSRHPFYAELMEEEFERIKENYKEVRDVFYINSADICAWGEFLKKNNYQAAVWITGSDEFKPYKYMSMKLPQYEEHNRDNRDIKGAFTKSFYVEEVQRNDSSDDFVSTISGTKVREALENGDKESFKKMMPKGTDYLFDKFKEALAAAPKAPEKKSRKKIKECIDNLKPVDLYITEKLRINKNLVTHERELLGKVEDIIINYLSKNYWFSFYRDEYEITKKEDPNDSGLSVFLRCPKGLENYCKKNKIDFDGIGLDIAERIKKLLKVDWYWALHKEENLFEFSDGIV